MAWAEVVVLGGAGYRLPTEAEWEHACRAGSTTLFSFGPSANGTESNINGEAPLGTETKGPNLKRTTAVGSYKANGFGLFDLHGNVWEWCHDWYAEDAYAPFATTPAENPRGPDAGQFRIVRGGAYAEGAYVARGRTGHAGSLLAWRGSRVPRRPRGGMKAPFRRAPGAANRLRSECLRQGTGRTMSALGPRAVGQRHDRDGRFVG